MFIEIIRHTPAWVWIVLVLLVWRGVKLMRPQWVPLAATAILPGLFVLLSLAGVVSTFGTYSAALPAWLAGLALTAFEIQRRGAPADALYDAASRSFWLPGSVVPLLLMLAIFAVKYAVGVSLALHGAALRGEAMFIIGVGFAYGMVSGAFLGRTLRLWHLWRRDVRGTSAVA